jgi:hypothetical protein
VRSRGICTEWIFAKKVSSISTIICCVTGWRRTMYFWLALGRSKMCCT